MSSWKAILAWASAPALCAAQDMEPRRWTHLPIGTDVLAVGYVYTTGDLTFDPVLHIEDATVEMHTALASFTHYFALGQRTARVDVMIPTQSGRWEGLLDGSPRTVNRDGLADPAVRLSANLSGAPALRGQDFLGYRQAHPVRTTVGAALELRVPLGEYQEDKLINLGQNRFAIGTQLGALHTRGEWSFELTGSMYLFTDNDEFFGESELEQDPLYAAQAHVVKTFGPGFWLSLGAAYGWAGESTVDGVDKDDEKSNLLYGTAFGFQIGDTQSLRFAYARGDTLADVGADTHSLAAGWSIRF